MSVVQQTVPTIVARVWNWAAHSWLKRGLCFWAI